MSLKRLYLVFLESDLTINIEDINIVNSSLYDDKIVIDFNDAISYYKKVHISH